MQKIAVIVVAGIIAMIGWQVGRCEIANIEFRDDLEDMASQLGTRVGLAAPSSNEDFRNTVIRAARKYGIELAPNQVIVQRTRIQNGETLFLKADYNTRVQLPGFSFSLHFTPASGKKTLSYSAP